MSEYVPTGPFVNGTSPGITAAFLNNIEAFIEQLEADTGASTISGSTSGTATLYQPLQGNFKVLIVRFNNFRNGSAPAQTLAIPTPITAVEYIFTSNCGAFQVLSSSVAQTVAQITSFVTNADNGVNLTTTLHQNWVAHGAAPIDTISLNGSDAGTHNGLIVIIGI